MTLESLLPSLPYSKKLANKMKQFRFGGYFTFKEAEEKQMRLAIGKAEKEKEKVALYWLVDESDGIIADAKFQVFGSPFLIAAAEIGCELVIRKTYDQASRISADLLDASVRDKKNKSAFPKESDSYLNLILTAIDQAVYQCIDIPFAATDFETPIDWSQWEIGEPMKGWEEFPIDKKVKIIEEVIDKEIRPYVEMDAGGVKIKELNEQNELIISYEGSCTSCHSATGSTLSAIQQILKARIHPQLTVLADL